MINKSQRPFIPEDGLRYLGDFLSVARSGSITKAADVIHKAPSAITRSILDYETNLGSNLFERRPRGMLLNAYGEAMLLRAQRVEYEITTTARDFCQNRSSTGLQDSGSLAGLLMSGRKLQIFVTMAEQRHVSVVAQTLGISQAGVSMSLARLEEAVGQSLFRRERDGMAPTDAAARLLVRAKRAFAELRHSHSELSALKGALQGTVTIGALPLCRTLILPHAIARTLERYPRLKIRTIESPYEALASGLNSGDIDFIVGALRPEGQTAGTITETLFYDQIAVIAGHQHPLLGRPDRITLNDLSREMWILPRRDSPSRQLLESSFREAGLPPPEPSVETGDLAILRTLLRSSRMLTAISPHQLHYEINDGSVAIVPLKLDKTRRNIGIIHRHGAIPSPSAKAVVDEIRRFLAGNTAFVTS